MGQVYANGILTIAAAFALNSTEGLFRTKDCIDHALPYLVENTEHDSKSALERRVICDPCLWQQEVDLCPLSTRAWVLQVCKAGL